MDHKPMLLKMGVFYVLVRSHMAAKFKEVFIKQENKSLTSYLQS